MCELIHFASIVYTRWVSCLFCTRILSNCIDSRYFVELVIFGGVLKGRGHKFSEFACYFLEKIRLDISCELSAGQIFHTKQQALFSLKN